jgi:co-chaperonin GroES (HSP10)
MIPALETFKPKMRPTGFNVLVGLPAAEKKIGSILLTDQALERERMGECRGRIVAMSPACFDFAEFPEDDRPKVGDAVIFTRHAGTVVHADFEYRLLLDKEIRAIVEDDHES